MVVSGEAEGGQRARVEVQKRRQEDPGLRDDHGVAPGVEEVGGGARALHVGDEKGEAVG